MSDNRTVSGSLFHDDDNKLVIYENCGNKRVSGQVQEIMHGLWFIKGRQAAFDCNSGWFQLHR